MTYLHSTQIMPKATRKQYMNFQQQPYSTAPTAKSKQGTIWSDEEDEVLLKAREKNLRWPSIQQQYFPQKSSNACRKRWERLTDSIRADDWSSEKLYRLAQEYANVRQEMWEILGARMGERWNVVEAKCMEKGVKGLQTFARTGQRKAAASRGRSSSFDEDEEGSADEHHDDSGVGFDADMEQETAQSYRNTSHGAISEHRDEPRVAQSQIEARTHFVQAPRVDHVRHDSRGQPMPDLKLYIPPMQPQTCLPLPLSRPAPLQPYEARHERLRCDTRGQPLPELPLYRPPPPIAGISSGAR